MFAFGAFVAVTALLAAVLGAVSGVIFVMIAEKLSPGSTASAGVNGGNDWALPILSILSLTGGAISAVIVLEPNVSKRRETILLSIAFLIVAVISWANYVNSDVLFSLREQALLDFVLATLSIAIIAILYQWRPIRPISVGVRTVSVFCLTLFGPRGHRCAIDRL